MGRIEKTVFISYRHTNLPWAIAIYQNLSSHGYDDVFFDYLSIDSGSFEKIILENIKAHAHFLVILTPSALERCKEPNDWLRREIETAIDEKRNIVPLMLEGFDFGSASTKEALTGKLAFLNAYNGISVYSEYFFEAMEKLRNRFLKVALTDVRLPPLTGEAKEANEAQNAAASKAPQVKKEELAAQELFERGLQTKENSERIRYFTDAIRDMPNHAESYYNRGLARHNINDLRGAIKDYTEALRIIPNYVEAYYERGLTYKDLKSMNLAIQDFTKAIRLKPDLAHAYLYRGIARVKDKQLSAAIKDFDKAIYLQPNMIEAYYNRGIANENNGSLDAALDDFTETIHLKPDFAKAYEGRARIWKAKKDSLSEEADLQKFRELGGINERIIIEKIISEEPKEKTVGEKLVETGVKATAVVGIAGAITGCAYTILYLLVIIGIVWLIIRIFWHG